MEKLQDLTLLNKFLFDQTREYRKRRKRHCRSYLKSWLKVANKVGSIEEFLEKAR